MLDYPDFDRDGQLSDVEFWSLPRTPAGDIVELAAWHPFLSEDHRLWLTPDDAARVEEFDLEAGSLFSDVLAELGICVGIVKRWTFEAA